MTTQIFQPDATAGIDTTIASGTPTHNFGIKTQILVGRHSDGSQNVGLIKFNITGIPANAIITSAVLSLYCSAENNTTDRVCSVHRSLVEWFEGAKDGAAPDVGQNGSTWNLRNANGAAAWAGFAGGGPGTDYASSATASVNITGTGFFFDWNVTADVQNFVNGTQTNHGWFIHGIVATNSRKIFVSSDETTASLRPKLTITYLDMIGTSAGVSGSTAALRGTGYLRGGAAGVATLSAEATSNEYVVGSASGAAAGSGTMRASGYAVAQGIGSSLAIADIQGSFNLVAQTSGVGIAAGDIKGVYQIAGSTAGTSTTFAFANFQGRLRGTAGGSSTLAALGWGKATGVAAVIGCNPLPALFITDGSIKNNGQLNILNFLSEGSGFRLKNWRPQISQYKEGGRFSNGPLAQGRRLRYRNFDNAIEIFELSAVSHDQDALIVYQQELLAWQEAAADYWVSDYVINPIYIGARAARESHVRYAVIHMMSIAELENPYTQPFYNPNHAGMDTLTVRIERGHWLATPPGKFECVAVSSIRSWTVSGWASGS